jgi:subtilisin family serine protease
MSYKRLFLLLAVAFATGGSFAQSTFFIKYKNSVPRQEVERRVVQQSVANDALGKSIIQTPAKVDYFARGIVKNDEVLSRIIKVTFNSVINSDSFIESLKNNPDIEYVQPSNIYKIEAATPNDSLIAEQWALSKINAFAAWDITKGSDTILVAVIDTGIDYLHPDLKNKIYINKGETGLDAYGKDKRTNGIDDDGDGFIDNYMGWDFVDRQGFPFDSLSGDYLSWDNDPLDENTHGTNIAGILAAETNNGIGIAGVAPNLKIVNLRAFDPNGNGEEDDVAAAILYAVKAGVKVINMSFGDTQFSYVLRDVIRYAYSQNVVLVASSGNSNSTLPHYPSGYPEVICVGNSTPDDNVSGDSNYGSTLDLVAPGYGIVTTALKKPYDVVYGTSAAAPFVSAAAGLILSVKNFTPEEVKQILKSTASDIMTQGWDIRSGSGRLDLYKALSVLAPGNVKITFPTQDYTTKEDTLTVTGSVISPYFKSFELDYGYGYTPSNWFQVKTGSYQVANSVLGKLAIKNLKDSVYTLRIVLYETNGNQQEERINFYVLRNAPSVELLNVASMFYGNRSTVYAELVTDQKCVTRMYYRKAGSTDFNFVTLDGFTINNQFVKNLHYGFIPKQLVDDNTEYELYFEAENMEGVKTVLKDSLNYFVVKTGQFGLVQANEMPFSLPKGTIFQDPVKFLSTKGNEALFNQYYEIQDTSKSFLSYCLFKLEDNKFIKVTTDSLLNKIPRTVADLNNDGKTDILSTMVRNGYIDEQTQANSFTLKNTFKDETGRIFPVFAKDIDGDGITDVVALQGNDTIAVYNWVNNTMVKKASLVNFSFNDPYSLYSNVLMRNIITADCNNDGVQELWFVDRDGDIVSYKITGLGTFQQNLVIPTNYGSDYNNIITAGDYDGDGVTDIAALFNSDSSYAVAPFQYLLIFNMKGNKPNLLYQSYFLDQSTEFRSMAFNKSVNNSIRFVDIDNDKKSELVISAFPYSYILKRVGSEDKMIFYKEGVNSYSVFSGDLNGNGINEIGLETTNGVKFYEFGSASQPLTPSRVEGYSLSEKIVYLTWKADGVKYYIYRGLSADNYTLIDSCTGNIYADASVSPNVTYYYRIKGYSPYKEVKYSDMSDAVAIFSHAPAKLIKAESKSSKTALVTFSDRINNTIENLQAFEITGAGFPSSISAASQYSYLLTFANDLPAGQNRISVISLHDYYGSPITDGSIDFNVDSVKAQQQKLYITTYELIDKAKIRVDFNLPVDAASASDFKNYNFSPENFISKIELANEGKSIYIYLDGKRPIGSIGREYRLQINNLVSSAGTGNAPIVDEAGSYAILTAVAANLSDVYVYPNPARPGSGQGKITFANLPRRAKVTIMKLNGEQIFSLNENDGDGGADFNLRDKNGDMLASGIYLFRIVMLDEFNNEVEKKYGKFAVVR